MLAAVLRAGLAHPTPAGLLSALQAAHGLVARYVPAPDPDDDVLGHIVVPITVGERWCAHCGDVGSAVFVDPDAPVRRRAECCRRPHLVPVVDILQAEEYFLR